MKNKHNKTESKISVVIFSLYQILCKFILVCVYIFGYKLIPDKYDVFAYYDENSNFYYAYGIKPMLFYFVVLFFIICFLCIIPIVTKYVLRDKYKHFEEYGLRVLKTKVSKKIIILLLVLINIMGLFFAYRDIDCIIVRNEGLEFKNNELMSNTSLVHPFTYLKRHKIYFTGNDVAIFKLTSTNTSELRRKEFSIGKYSTHVKTLIDVLDEKTNYQYDLKKIFNCPD